ncbi:hypothetical protein STVIR_4711 [Streptomyces viridochromogenes Tue57]|uniref:Uncharacterized protein n=1 Tax=Streptomyces viridochromogenes Tue57 TaxID=1160705 RepID=L8PCV5_STRVR|nr:hypothetical protein STVIR_4711 [Streptomyces viridochromogenes Tue57]
MSTASAALTRLGLGWHTPPCGSKVTWPRRAQPRVNARSATEGSWLLSGFPLPGPLPPLCGALPVPSYA